MIRRLRVGIAVALMTLSVVGTHVVGATAEKPCAPAFQSFDIGVFDEQIAAQLWPTGAEAYETQADAEADFPGSGLEAFFWSNVTIKAGTMAALTEVDFDGDGQLCMKYVVNEFGHFARLFSDYDPLYFFIFGDKGR